jgi:hypothetical protein
MACAIVVVDMEVPDVNHHSCCLFGIRLAAHRCVAGITSLLPLTKATLISRARMIVIQSVPDLTASQLTELAIILTGV